MVGIDFKAIVLKNLIEHALYDRIVNFLFFSTLSADQMMMAMWKRKSRLL